jgi:polyvinyl alcohol dehydrogenase (cytochrome)
MTAGPATSRVATWGALLVAGLLRAPFLSAQTPTPEMVKCAPQAFGDPLAAAMWNGWGADTGNTRFQPAAAAGIAAGDVPKLGLLWALGFPSGEYVASQPTVVGGRIYIGTGGPGGVYSLDSASGCAYWAFHAQNTVRTAVTIGRLTGAAVPAYAAFFGDLGANVYAIDAETGLHLWSKRVDLHPQARITGAPTLYEGRLYVPVSSLEEAAAGSSTYECCTFRGSVVAYEAATGQEIWRT